MALKLDKPIVFFDLEATGVDTMRDRVVQVACVRLSPDGSRESYETLVNPEGPIPPEAAAVHHITDDMVKDAPTFRDLAPKLLEYFGDSDLGGFGIVRYDVPLVTNEFKRAGIFFDTSKRRLVDAMLIYHKMEPRNLSAALRFYCGKEMDNAHNALADTEATVDVFMAQLEKYRDRPAPLVSLPGDVKGIHEFCNAQDPRNVDARGKFVWRHGVATFNFGKHQSRSLEDVVRSDRSYVEWLMNAESTTPEVAAICRQALIGAFPRQSAKAAS